VREVAPDALRSELPPAPCCHTIGYRVVKRAIDIVSSASALVLLSPLLGLIALLVKLSSSGPCFYRWEVVGRGGQRFRGYKFRSMVVDADALKKDLSRHNERKGPTFKMKDDPRITRVGRVLRRFSLDELPQLWSVLKGDMSLVGPRPVGPSEWEQFADWQRRKLTVTPGMICLWHVRGKPEAFDQWIKLDLEYIDTWSLWRDVRLVLDSAWYMASGRNY
jgi:lipopolysaccharide/colanic/teichoic acid biosynthesis glycosyltransferase